MPSCCTDALSRYATPARVLFVRLQMTPFAAGVLLGSVIQEAAEPIITLIGGTAALGSALACVHEWSKDEPQWDQAMGTGAVLGAVAGAALLLLDTALAR